MNQEEIIKRLREPFSSQEVEWKLQVTSQDKARGMAVAYLDARAVQRRLDEVVGAFGWSSEYLPWQDNAQLCRLSLYCAERQEWISKSDGAENSDVEPIKGGLSDSFKRAACAWGVGRYMYEIGGVWVDLEARGKSYVIKDHQYSRLETEYNKAVSRIFSAAHENQEKILSGSHAGSVNPKTPPTQPSEGDNQPPVTASYDFTVKAVKPSGKSSQLLELINSDGEVIKAYIKTSDRSISSGSCLRKVQMERKQSSYGEYNLINAYQIAA